MIRVDLQHGKDVRLLEHLGEPVHGILCAPPCDHFAQCGSQWWARKGEQAVLDGLAIVDACLRAVAIYRPEFWALENPVGRLKTFLGPARWRFDPCDFGGDTGENYSKKTLLWGHFTPPMPLFSATARTAVAATDGSRTHRMSSTWKNQRSQTPLGFSRAFFEANP